MTAEVSFHSADRSLTLAGKTTAKAFIQKIFLKEKRKLAAIHYIFCSDEHLLQMNKNFLLHDYYTDIITFDLSGKNEPVVAEIYISVDRVKDNAKTLDVSFREEVLRVIFHGALHLCGYQDKTKSQILLMRAKEDQYLRMYQKSLLNA
jgi:rRNA maturation RNase YbeY